MMKAKRKADFWEVEDRVIDVTRDAIQRLRERADTLRREADGLDYEAKQIASAFERAGISMDVRR